MGGGGGRRAGLRRAGGRPAARRAVDPCRDLDELGHSRRVRADGHRRGADRRGGRGREPGEIGTLAYYCDCTIVDAFSDRGRIIAPPSRPASGRAASARPSCGSTTCTSTATRRPGPSSTGCATRRTSRPRGPSSGAWTTGWTAPAASCWSDEFALRRRSTGHGRGSSSGRHPQGRVRPDRRRRAEGLEGRRSALRGLGGVPPEGLARPTPTASARRQSTGWFGQLIQRSDDGGSDLGRRSGNEFTYAGVPGTHQWYDGTPHPWEFARVWHLEPSLTDPDTVLRRRRGRRAVPVGRRRPAPGRSCPACASTAPARTGSPARAACACTRSCSTRATPTGCSSRSRRRACSAPTTAARPGGRPTRACVSEGIPDPDAEVGHCVHKLALHPDRPETRVHAEALGRHAQRRRRRALARGQRQPAHRLRLRHRRARPRAGDGLRRADHQRLRALPARGQAAGVPQPHRRQRVGAADEGPAAGALLRQRAARRDGGRRARRLRRLLRHDRRAGLRSADGGDTWAPIVRDLPAVLSVEVQTLS